MATGGALSNRTIDNSHCRPLGGISVRLGLTLGYIASSNSCLVAVHMEPFSLRGYGILLRCHTVNIHSLSRVEATLP